MSQDHIRPGSLDIKPDSPDIKPGSPDIRPGSLDSMVMAFCGDAVYEVFVRDRVIADGTVKGSKLYRQTVRYVRAENQAKAMKAILDHLDEDELSMVRRAKNHKITSKPNHVDPMTYKWATALEALIGYLHVTGKEERLREIMDMAFEAIDEE